MLKVPVEELYSRLQVPLNGLEMKAKMVPAKFHVKDLDEGKRSQ